MATTMIARCRHLRAMLGCRKVLRHRPRLLPMKSGQIVFRHQARRRADKTKIDVAGIEPIPSMLCSA
jgi:hypothetical protein